MLGLKWHMLNNTIHSRNAFSVLMKLSALLVLYFAVSCGSSSDRTFISGNVSLDSTNRQKNDTSPGGRTLANIRICALDKCGVTNEKGDFGFNIPRLNDFPGGNLLFNIEIDGVSVNFTVNNVTPNPEFIFIRIVVFPDGRILAFTESTSGSGSGFGESEIMIGGFNPPAPLATATSAPSFNPDPTPFATPTVVSTPTTSFGGCADLEGSFSGNNGCQIGTTFVSSGFVLSPFGSNSNVAFVVDGSSGTSVSNNLVLFNKPGHKCNANCSSTGFEINCFDNSNSCRENFSK